MAGLKWRGMKGMEGAERGLNDGHEMAVKGVIERHGKAEMEGMEGLE